MAYQVPEVGWVAFFYPFTVLSSGSGYGQGSNREYPPFDPDLWMIMENGSLLITDTALYFFYPGAGVLPEGEGTGRFFVFGVTDETFAFLLGKTITLDEGTSFAVDADANTGTGQLFSYSDPDYPPSFVASVEGLIAVS